MTHEDKSAGRRPTIYDIARIAGTSGSSVSAVLNGTWKQRRISATLAARVRQIAQQQGYSVNLQASLLRRERSRIIGMIIPKYDNRYFGAIAEQFETIARARGLFPVMTCTQRDPDLEIEAAREMMSYQAEYLIVTGASDPDRIAMLCRPAGVRVVNLDLPGSKVASVVSDNFTGARDLTRLILARMGQDFGAIGPLHFLGGRPHDHNTGERLRGFLAAHAERGLVVPDHNRIMHGYSAARNHAALMACGLPDFSGVFVNSTIALEGLARWLSDRTPPPQLRFGCFDWDPFARFLPQNVGMVMQDVDAMLAKVFDFIDHPANGAPLVEIPCILKPSEGGGDGPPACPDTSRDISSGASAPHAECTSTLDTLFLPARGYQAMPWKNGKGATDEIWRWPPDGDDFQIRVSRASIIQPGLFSPFPGIDRVITLIEGQGLALDFGDHVHDLTPLAPFCLDGGLTPDGRPQGGPVRVLDVMIRSTGWRFGFAHVLPGAGQSRAPLILVFALESQGVTAGDRQFDLAAQDSLVTGAGDVVTSGRALVVGLRPVCV